MKTGYTLAVSPMKPLYAYRAKYLRAKDGDTFEFLVDCGFHVHTVIAVRLADYSAPESTELNGPEATQAADRLLSEAKEIVILTRKRRTGTDVRSFTRYVADVWVDDKLLATLMRETGIPEGGT